MWILIRTSFDAKIGVVGLTTFQNFSKVTATVFAIQLAKFRVQENSTCSCNRLILTKKVIFQKAYVDVEMGFEQWSRPVLAKRKWFIIMPNRTVIIHLGHKNGCTWISRNFQDQLQTIMLLSCQLLEAKTVYTSIFSSGFENFFIFTCTSKTNVT